MPAAPLNLSTVRYITDPDVRLTTAMSNSTAETTFLSRIIPGTFSNTPSGLLSFTAITFKCAFQISTVALLPPTLTINMRLGTTQLISLLANQALVGGASSQTIVIESSINSISQSSQTAVGEVRLPATPIFSLLTASDVISSGPTPWAVDTTQDQQCWLTAKFSTANAANSIKMIRGIMTFG